MKEWLAAKVRDSNQLAFSLVTEKLLLKKLQKNSLTTTLFRRSRQNSSPLCAFELGYNDFCYIVTSRIATLFVGHQSERLKSHRRPLRISKHGANLFYPLKPATNRRIVQIIKTKPTAPARGVRTQPTKSACDTRRNCMSVHVCLFQLFGATLNSSKKRPPLNTVSEADVLSDLVQFLVWQLEVVELVSPAGDMLFFCRGNFGQVKENSVMGPEINKYLWSHLSLVLWKSVCVFTKQKFFGLCVRFKFF